MPQPFNAMSRVIFVGMHNKPGLAPLDSSTKSGKIIDRIIAELGSSVECVKTNLIDAESLPANADEIRRSNHLWLCENRATEKDIVVLLGHWVAENFWWADSMIAVNLAHPSWVVRKGKVDGYVADAVNLIREALKKH